MLAQATGTWRARRSCTGTRATAGPSQWSCLPAAWYVLTFHATSIIQKESIGAAGIDDCDDCIAQVEYKFFVLAADGMHAAAWQSGNNSVLAVQAGEEALEVYDNW
jgi:hypothetical protein